MMNKLTRKWIGGKRLGFVALVFSALFFISSLQVYRDEMQVRKDYEAASEKLRLAFEAFASTSEPALTLTALSACESSSHDQALYKSARKDHMRVCNLYQANKDAEKSTLAALNSYEKALSVLGSTAKINKEGSFYIVHFASHGLIDTNYKIPLNNSVDDYSSDRLFLESQRQSGNLSNREYVAKVSQLSTAYSERFSMFEHIDNEQSLRLQIDTAEQRLTKLQAQVESLEKQLAQAERTLFEKWIPIVTAILTALIALSANFVAWRTDRRQAREAELLPLKRQELQQNIIQKDQQIEEIKSVIITPTREELERYSRSNTS